MAEEPNEDLSMDDILSSIRNILMEDNAVQQATPQPEEPVAQTFNQPAAPSAVQTEAVALPEDGSIDFDDLPAIGDEDIGLLSSEDEVFDLSPAMIIDDAADKPAAEQPAPVAEPEISEDDILDLNNLMPAQPVEVEPVRPSAPAVTPAPEKNPGAEAVAPSVRASFEPSVPSMRMSAPLASEVLSEEEFLPDAESEISVDDIMNLSSLVERNTTANSGEEETTLNLADEFELENDSLGNIDDSDFPAFSIRDNEEDISGQNLTPVSFSEEGEQSADLSSIGLEVEAVDVESEPIFEPEISAAPEVDPSQLMDSMSAAQNMTVSEPEEETAIDADTLNEIIDFHAQVEETKPAILPETEIEVEPEEVEITEADPTDNIQDIISEPVVEMDEPEIETDQEAETIKTADAADVSANIISNFAKLFAEKKAVEMSNEPVAVAESAQNQVSVKTASPSISELVREAVVKQVTQQMDVNFESYAREAVAAQTQAWLDANLPAIVEAVVSKEIERVMAKVGS